MNNPIFQEYDVVSLREGLSSQLRPETMGVIVFVHDEVRGIYEVEFFDGNETIEVATVTADQIQLMVRPDS